MKLELKAYPVDKRLCCYSYLQRYLHVTQSLRGEKRLFISHRKPNEKVSKDTTARWIKTVMMNAGVDTSVFKPHSTRSAAVSKANAAAVPISNILNTAGWGNARAFAVYYKKPIAKAKQDFADAILKTAN